MRKPVKLDDAQFVSSYMAAIKSGKCLSLYAKSIGYGTADVYNRAANLRAHGVNLPRFPTEMKKKTKAYYDALNALIA